MTRYPRYAIYYAPAPTSHWWRFGCHWLGRDAITGKTFEPFYLPGVSSDDVAAITARPRTYGFHATLKPPFALHEDVNEHDLHRAVRNFARLQRTIDLGKLSLCVLDGFIALRPQGDAEAIAKLARSCVEHFDFLRAPPSLDELERRRRDKLTAHQEALLARWGYPYVLDEFRFHLTLTDRLTAEQRDTVLDGLSGLMRKLNTERSNIERLSLDALSVFEQAAPGAPFFLTHRYGFDGSFAHYDNGAMRPAGRLFYVVGPSGAGKDTLLDYVKARMAGQRSVIFAHRYITRPFSSGGENHVALDEAEFRLRQSAGAFAMAWHSHGFHYGIGVEIDHWLEQGIDVVVNGSRAYLQEAHRRYPGMTAVWITAPREILQARLYARGRENSATITTRLARADTFDVPEGIQVIKIANDAAIDAAGAELMRALCV